jgi:protein-L-isoaspartate(D-aspartate) O-methyltransferase
MKIGGVMVIPVNEDDVQRMMRITKTGEGAFQEERFDRFSFVPMLEGKSNQH